MPKGVNFSFHGRIGKDPVLKYVGAKQTATIEFSVAINMGPKDPTEWMDCVAWGDIALRIAEQFAKGSKIYIKESTPKTNRWEYQGKQCSKLRWVIWDFHGEEEADQQGESGFTPLPGDEDIPY